MNLTHHIRRSLVLAVAVAVTFGAAGAAGAAGATPTPASPSISSPQPPTPTPPVEAPTPPVEAPPTTDAPADDTNPPDDTPSTTIVPPSSTVTPTTTAPAPPPPPAPATTSPATPGHGSVHQPTSNSAQLSLVAAVAPTAPQSPAATPGNASVKLTWLAPSSTGGAAIDKYAVQRYTAEGWKTIAYPTALSYTNTGLTNGTKYSFRILAHNAAGWSPASTVVTAVPRTVPTAPLSPAATPSNGSVQLAWQKPSSNGGATIDKYAVQRYVPGTGWKTIAYPTGLSYTAGGLTNGTKYSFRVLAHNAAGYGPASTVLSATPFTVPGKPDWCAGQQWGGAGSHWMDGKFTAPSSDGGATVDYYRIDIWGFDNQGIFGPYYHLSEDNLYQGIYNDYKYLPYGDYLFSVAAHNAAGFGPACTAIGTLNP